jgi:hypothetical protein
MQGVQECAVFEKSGHSAHFRLHCKKNQVSKKPSGNSMVLSDIHDIGIPEPCTDIMFLLIDDLLHTSEAKVDRYYRVWSSSGSAMLMSSTTVRSFNAAGYLDEVTHAMLVLSTMMDGPEAYHLPDDSNLILAMSSD